MITLKQLQEVLDVRFGGVLTAGKHEPDGEACAFECLSVVKGLEWTDNPNAIRSFDLRPINDILVSDEIRTKHLLPVIVAYDGSLDWPTEKQKEVVTKIIIGTVNQIVSELPYLSTEIREKCQSAKTLDEARNAAYTATDVAAATAAAYAVTAAVAAAYAATADAVITAVQEKVFITACQIWLEAARS